MCVWGENSLTDFLLFFFFVLCDEVCHAGDVLLPSGKLVTAIPCFVLLYRVWPVTSLFLIDCCCCRWVVPLSTLTCITLFLF